MNESMPSSAQPPQEARNPRIWLRVNGVFGLTDADSGCVVDIFPFQRRAPHESYHVGRVSVPWALDTWALGKSVSPLADASVTGVRIAGIRLATSPVTATGAAAGAGARLGRPSGSGVRGSCLGSFGCGRLRVDCRRFNCLKALS